MGQNTKKLFFHYQKPVKNARIMGQIFMADGGWD
jgi:hypothetical protein